MAWFRFSDCGLHLPCAPIYEHDNATGSGPATPVKRRALTNRIRMYAVSRDSVDFDQAPTMSDQ